MQMFSILFAIITFILAFHGVTVVQAGLYVVEPFSGSTCHGAEPCTVTWLDDGRTPLLASIGVMTVGLYTGQQKLVQSLEPVDVTAAHALTFTPNPAAGPTSDAYYIGFKSVQLLVNGTEPYTSYSPWFRLDRMTGSFENPLPSAISSVPVPSSLTTRRSTTVLSTITVGRPTASASTLATTVPSSAITSAPSSSTSSQSQSSLLPSSSGFVTSRISSSASSSAASSTASSTPSSSPPSSSSASRTSSGPSIQTSPATLPSEPVDADTGGASSTVASMWLSLVACLIVFFAI